MATVVNVLGLIETTLESTFQNRGAPDDEVHLAVAMSSLRDDEGDMASAAHIFLSVIGDSDHKSTHATLMVPLEHLTDDHTVTALADVLWDRVSARRIERVMNAEADLNQALEALAAEDVDDAETED